MQGLEQEKTYDSEKLTRMNYVQPELSIMNIKLLYQAWCRMGLNPVMLNGSDTANELTASWLSSRVMANISRRKCCGYLHTLANITLISVSINLT